METEGINSQPVEQASEHVGAEAVEQAPQYLTRDEALRLMRLMAEEYGRRGGQSYLDKQGIRERLATVEKVIKDLESEGVLDASQASSYRSRAQVDLLTQALAGEELEQQVDRRAPAVDPVQTVASITLELSGLTEADPEYQWLYGHSDPVSWSETLRKAVAAKKARLAREEAQRKEQQAKQAAPASAPPEVPLGARAVDLGSGTPAVTDLDTLYRAYEKAMLSGNRSEADRIYGEIRKLALGG